MNLLEGLRTRFRGARERDDTADLALFRTLAKHEAKHYSQNGEDGVIDCLFRRFGVTNRFYVEFGSGDGDECNTHWLRTQGWSGVLMDCSHEDPRIPVHRETVTAENLAPLFRKYGVPPSFDLLSIDVDGYDYWLWKAAATAYRPRVAVIEYNNEVPHDVSVTMPYSPAPGWPGPLRNSGASLRALKNVSEQLGYALVYAAAPNAFVVLKSLLPAGYNDARLRERGSSQAAQQIYRLRWHQELRHLQWVYV